jgi:hypothetical protein
MREVGTADVIGFTWVIDPVECIMPFLFATFSSVTDETRYACLGSVVRVHGAAMVIDRDQGLTA